MRHAHKPAKFSVIIPTARSTDLVDQCLRSFIKKHPDRNRYELIVCDDGSDFYTVSFLEELQKKLDFVLLKHDSNTGFAATVNRGLARSTGDIKILVNNDIVFTKPILDSVEMAFRLTARVGIVGAKLLYPNTRIQHAGMMWTGENFDLSHRFRNEHKDHLQVNTPCFLPGVTGALFCISDACYKAIGALSEQFFLACEDAEYCLRAWHSGFKVYYDPAIEAVHLEGATRGKTDSEKTAKAPEWAEKERQSIDTFNDMRKIYNNKRIQRLIDTANGQHYVRPKLTRLEIGSGYNPQPGYMHLDIRADLPEIDYVCDFAKDELPIPDKSLTEIVSNHSIEHISFRELPHVLSEWHRVLIPGGRVFLRTPDLEFICRKYLEKQTTPEWPGDEDYIREHLSSEVTPAWWANIKLFAGQDYPSNFHFMCFDFDMIKSLLERYGFERVSRVSMRPIFSPGELQVEAFRSDVKKVLVKRKGALGDVIMTTPIVKALSETCEVHVATDSPVVYANNPRVAKVHKWDHDDSYDEVIDLDLSYELTPKRHVIDSYLSKAGLPESIDRVCEIFPSLDDITVVDRMLSGIRPVVMHMGKTWQNRTIPIEVWEAVASLLIKKGEHIICVGSQGDFTLPCVSDWRNKLSIQQIKVLIARAKAFIGNDTGLLHVAGTTDTKVVALFTSAKMEYRLPFSKNATGIQSVCNGCLHEAPVPVTFIGCPKGTFHCVSEFDPEMIVKSVYTS